MRVVKGTVVNGVVVFDQAGLPDGTAVAVLALEQYGVAEDAPVRLPAALQQELEEALIKADHSPGISARELLAELAKYG